MLYASQSELSCKKGQNTCVLLLKSVLPLHMLLLQGRQSHGAGGIHLSSVPHSGGVCRPDPACEAAAVEPKSFKYSAL